MAGETVTGGVEVIGHRPSTDSNQPLTANWADVASLLDAMSRGYAPPGTYADAGAAAGAPAMPEVVVSAPRPTPAPRPSPSPTPRPSGPSFAPPPPYAPSEAFLMPPPVRQQPLPPTQPSSPRLRPSPARVRPSAPPRTAVPRVGRGLGLLALVPPYMWLLGKADEHATQRMLDRLRPPPRGGGRGIANPELPPDPFRYGEPGIWNLWGVIVPDWNERRARRPGTGGDYGRVVPVPGDELPEVVVTTARPRTDVEPAPTRVPVPFGAPTLVPVGVPESPYLSPVGDPAPFVAPQPATRPLPRPIPQPNPAPLAPPIPNPELRPEVQPQPRQRPTPTPRTPVVAAPVPFLAAQPQPLPTPGGRLSDPCDCEKTKPKTKNKKRKDRSVCWGGTFIEKSSSLSKRRRYRVDCKTGKKL